MSYRPEASTRKPSILSWNVHDIVNQTLVSKTTQDEFCDILKTGVIFCLQETEAEVQIPNYMCYNKLRPTSRSGGPTIVVHRSEINQQSSDRNSLEV
jgi:hypothetical protein